MMGERWKEGKIGGKEERRNERRKCRKEARVKS